MKFHLPSIVCGLLVLAFGASSIARAQDYPKPSPYPITWELKFEHDKPRRIVVEVPGQPPQAYWYMTYTVTNESDQEQLFLPYFLLLTRDGRVLRSDQNIPQRVFERIKQVEANRFLEPFTQIGGELRLGEDEARDGVAIWPEPDPRMGTFSIFVQGLSGETTTARDEKGQPLLNKDGKPILLRKTLQLTYQIRGDESFPEQNQVIDQGSEWVMR